jgi:hypothetical protein
MLLNDMAVNAAAEATRMMVSDLGVNGVMGGENG